MSLKINLVVFIALLMLTNAFSQEISYSYWNNNTTYNEIMNIVFSEGVRYRAISDNLNEKPKLSENEEYEYEYWERLTPLITPIPDGEVTIRLLPKAHEKVKDILVEIDGMVMGVEKLYDSDILDKISKVAATREKEIVGSYLHSSWVNFMVDGWDDVYNTFQLKRIEKDEYINFDDIDKNEYIRLLRPHISREYRNYRYTSYDDPNIVVPILGSALSGAMADIFADRIMSKLTSKGRTGAYEQILHNIGDAGVAFGHALEDLSGSSNNEDDIREEANEFAAKKAMNALAGDKERQEFAREYYISGSIYDAIAEYGYRTIEAVNWAKQNIPATGDCNSGKTVAKNDNCYRDHEDKFKTLVKGKGNPIHGVTGSAIAVGRMILIDAMLSEQPLEHERIFGTSFFKPYDTSYTFNAYARDPDAVVIVHKDSLYSQITTNSKRLIYDVEDGLENPIPYELWHKPEAHDMYYEWFINGNRIFKNSSIEKQYNACVEKEASYLNTHNSYTEALDSFNIVYSLHYWKEESLKEHNKQCSIESGSCYECNSLITECENLRIKRDSLKTISDSLNKTYENLQNEYKKMLKSYYSLCKSPDIELEVILPPELELNSLKDGINAKIKIKVSSYSDKSYEVDLKNSNLDLSVRITDDEYSYIIAEKQLTFFDRVPVAKIGTSQTNAANPYITKVAEKNIFSQDLLNNYDYFDGFSDSTCYEPLFLNAFGASIDPDGNASDQITKVEYLVGNEDDSILVKLRGINQQYDTIVTLKNGEKIIEKRYIINNSLCLQTKEDEKLKLLAEERFVSSTWNNTDSPDTIINTFLQDLDYGENYKVRVNVYDNEASSAANSFDVSVLVPPVIDFAELSTQHLISNINGETYNSNTIVLGGEDMVLKLYAIAYDPDNGDDAKKYSQGIEHYYWEIREIGSNDNMKFSNKDLRGDSLTFTYRELLELGLNIEIGKAYEVFLKVEDDDKKITGNGYGFAAQKIGEFRLAHPLYDPDMFDASVDEWILGKY